MEWRWCNRETHPHLSRLSDISLGLEQFADVQGLSAPEVPVDAPVEGELEGPPVEASAAASVSARKRRRWRVLAYRTCILELMTAMALPVQGVAEGRNVVRGRNASLLSQMAW